MAQDKTLTNGQLVCQTIAKNEAEYKLILPAHITPAKFIRTAQSAIASNGDLMNCTKQSLYLAVEQAAKDGLIIDGKQAAIVVFNRNTAKKGQPEHWVKEAKYMPMMGGLMQLARNSGQVSTPVSEIVYENDKFLYHIKNGKIEIDHSPNIFGNRGKKIGAYSSCIIHKTGEVIAEVMTAEQIQNVRNCSKAKDSPMWTTFEEEGWKKTVFRRMYKRMPSSSDKEESPDAQRLSSAATRDDDLYEFDDSSVVDAHVEPKPDKQTRAAQAVTRTMYEEIPFNDNNLQDVSNNLHEDDVI